MTQPKESVQEFSYIIFFHTCKVINKYLNSYINKNSSLSLPQVAALRDIINKGGTVNPSAIAATTYTERNNITVLTKRMVDAGLVSTQRDDNDKRLVNIFMTEKGKDIFAQTQPILTEMNNNITKALSEDNTLLLTRFLRVILDNAKAGLAKIDEEKQKSKDL